MKGGTSGPKTREELPEFDLNLLVGQITDQNRHDEVNTGKPAGGEFPSTAARGPQI
jgi:hypothetical protein